MFKENAWEDYYFFNHYNQPNKDSTDTELENKNNSAFCKDLVKHHWAIFWATTDNQEYENGSLRKLLKKREA